MNPLDLAIQNATKIESKLSADRSNLENLKAAAKAAAEPVPAAQGVVDQDELDFDASMDALSAAALDAKIHKPVPAPPPVPTINANGSISFVGSSNLS